MSDTPTPLEPEGRIDEVFDQAFEANHPAMLDWVEIKFALKKARQRDSELQQEDAQIAALRNALKRLCKAASDVELGRVIHNERFPDRKIDGIVWTDLFIQLREANEMLEALSSPPPPVVPLADAEALAYTLGLLGSYSSFREENRKSDANVRQVATDALIKYRVKHPKQDPDLGPISEGHVCKHNIRWPHPCQACANAAWEADLVKHQQEKEGA